MLPSPSPRRRVAIAVGLVAVLGLSGAAAPRAQAASTPPHGMGLQPSPAAAVAAAARPQAAAAAVASTAPDAVDLTPWAVAAGDQGNVGSCVSWTVGYTISGWYARRHGRAGVPYAPMFLYSQITGGHGGPSVGTTFYGNLSLETASGIDPLAAYPQGNYDSATLPSAGQRTTALDYRIADWTTLYWTQAQAATQGAALIKDALAHDRPVALGMNVYSNFFAVRSNSDHYGGVSGSFAGRHAVAVLAYDSYGVKIENSWSTGWGNQGFAWLSWNVVATQTFEAYSVNGFNAPVSASAPTITGLDADHGPWPGGGRITVTGTNLTGAAVTFGSVASPSVTVNGGGTSATATAPAGTPGAVVVAVTTAGGGRSNTVRYTYDAAAPVVGGISPAAGPAGGGTRVTVTGSNLFGPATVLFGTTPATAVTPASDGQSLTAVAPAGAVGGVDVTVRNPGGTSGATRFMNQWPVAPVVAASAPAAVAPGNVTIAGVLTQPPRNTVMPGFPVALQARAAGSGAAFTTVATGTTARNGTVAFVRPISVATEFRLAIIGDVVSNVVSVAVAPPPTVNGVSTNSGPRAGGQSVTVTGTNLQGVQVTVDGTVARVASIAADGTSLTFVTPSSRRTGVTSVAVIGATGSARPFNYTYR